MSINSIKYSTICDDCVLKLICKIHAYACVMDASAHAYACILHTYIDVSNEKLAK